MMSKNEHNRMEVESTTDRHEDNSDAVETMQEPLSIRNLNVVPASLKIWNGVAVIVQFAQAAALFALSANADNAYYWYTNYPATFEDRDENPEEFGRPGPTEVADFSITWYSAVFILLSGLDHLTCIIFWSTYKYQIERHQNHFRWAEYSISASLMRIMIAQLAGVTDIHLIWMLFASAAITMILGGIHESVNAKARADGLKQNWYPFLAAWIPHLACWLVIFNYFFKAVIEGDPPNFVWAIIFVLFFLDGCFAILFTLQWFKIGIFKDYVAGEKGFIVLSFTAKVLLAWINYGGGSR